VISSDELRAMQRLTQEAWRLRPEHVDVTLGGMSYTWGVQNERYSDEWLHRLWLDGDRALAWAWLFLPSSLEWQVHPDHSDLLDEVLDWFEGAARSDERAVAVREANLDARSRLERRGFLRDDAAPWMRLNMRELGEIEAPRLPAGFRLRTMKDVGGDVAGRVAVHQASWREFGTRVTKQTYANVVQTWPYRSDLDLLVETPDGDFGAFALAWYDPDNRVGEFEPVGTDPRFRRRGLGRALSLFGLEKLRELGATHAIVQSRGDEAHPGPSRLYESVGFREFSRNCRYVKR
jgi:GNAT superfamily N-acetyltransferase